jgi:hypothetical protein
MSNTTQFQRSQEKVGIDQASLDQYVNSARGKANGGERLRGQEFYKDVGSNDSTSGNPEIDNLLRDYNSWVDDENKRVQKHEEYKALAADQPGRKATILADTSMKTVLGGAGY